MEHGGDGAWRATGVQGMVARRGMAMQRGTATQRWMGRTWGRARSIRIGYVVPCGAAGGAVVGIETLCGLGASGRVPEAGRRVVTK